MDSVNSTAGQPHMAGVNRSKCECERKALLVLKDKLAAHRASLSKMPVRESQDCPKCQLPGRPAPASLIPPLNFSTVCEGLYRSSYPQAGDYPFIQQLKLKTIVTLVSKELPEGYQQFLDANQITHKIFDMAGTKKEEISVSMMRSIHSVISQTENYPLLIHCNHGKHRTGCVVGIFRKANQWKLNHIIAEYSSFAEPKVRETDIKYLSEFQITGLLNQPRKMALPSTPNRFGRFVVAVALLLFMMSSLGRFRATDLHQHSSRS
ncbi:tyrosine phosphatase family-domain-containing protein [Astrocystis sublimbata]|nr:tyrosine phosphatase family-domain-containing protein [Astrocystis sublimbata]